MTIVRKLGLGVFILLGVIAILLLINHKKIIRLLAVNSLFDKEVIVDNFQHMDEIFDTSEMTASPDPIVLPQAKDHYQLPESFESKGKTIEIENYLEDTNTEGLMIIHKDTVIYEQYWLGLEADDPHISWSMSKSFTSLLVGQLIEEGEMSLNDEVQDILPQFLDSGYDGVTVKQLLNMASGVRFNEDYGDFDSDINRFGRTFALGKSLEEFALTLTREREPGTYNQYVSIDTQVLGLMIREITGQSITDLAQAQIWNRLGMQDDAYWIIDKTGMEVTLGGLNASLRDYAKIGVLYLNDGNIGGDQVVSSDWVTASVTPDAPHLLPNQTKTSSTLYGYGYQWWVPQYPDNDYFATGVYDQFVYVNTEKDLVIAKLSADHHYRQNRVEIKSTHIDLFQSIAKTF